MALPVEFLIISYNPELDLYSHLLAKLIINVIYVSSIVFKKNINYIFDISNIILMRFVKIFD